MTKSKTPMSMSDLLSGVRVKDYLCNRYDVTLTGRGWDVHDEDGDFVFFIPSHICGTKTQEDVNQMKVLVKWVSEQRRHAEEIGYRRGTLDAQEAMRRALGIKE
jgi:hypothetical protein